MEAADTTTTSSSEEEYVAVCCGCGNNPPRVECVQCGRSWCGTCMLKVKFDVAASLCRLCRDDDTDDATTEEDS